MKSTLPRGLIEIEYYDAAQRYLRSLPPEHFMEAMPQGTQRKITLESLDLVHARRPDVQIFNELLVQYPLGDDGKEIGQVVPDNMVVVHDEPIQLEGSFDLPLQPVGPFWVLEYVSRNSRRKDYNDNFEHYEKQLKVPYFLLFYPEPQELTLFHFDKKKKRFQPVKANRHGRLEIPELELEVALHDKWVRLWFRGELVPLPGDLLFELDATKRLLAEVRLRADQAERELVALDREIERQRELAERSGDQVEQDLVARDREIECLRAMLREKGELPPT